MSRLFAPKLSLLLVVALLFPACGKPSSGDQDATAPADAGETASLEPAALLTDAKVAQYVVYWREMVPHTREVLEQGMAAMGRGGKRDEAALQQIAQYEKAALAKSGLTRLEANRLAKLLSATIAPRSMGSDESKQQARAQFAEQYGQQAAAAVQKHEADLLAIQDQMFSSMKPK